MQNLIKKIMWNENEVEYNHINIQGWTSTTNNYFSDSSSLVKLPHLIIKISLFLFFNSFRTLFQHQWIISQACKLNQSLQNPKNPRKRIEKNTLNIVMKEKNEGLLLPTAIYNSGMGREEIKRVISLRHSRRLSKFLSTAALKYVNRMEISALQLECHSIFHTLDLQEDKKFWNPLLGMTTWCQQKAHEKSFNIVQCD